MGEELILVVGDNNSTFCGNGLGVIIRYKTSKEAKGVFKKPGNKIKFVVFNSKLDEDGEVGFDLFRELNKIGFLKNNFFIAVTKNSYSNSFYYMYGKKNNHILIAKDMEMAQGIIRKIIEEEGVCNNGK